MKKGLTFAIVWSVCSILLCRSGVSEFLVCRGAISEDAAITSAAAVYAAGAFEAQSASCELLPADYSKDCSVNFEDFALLAADWPRIYSWHDLLLLSSNWLADATIEQNAVVARVYPDKARYDPGDSVILTVEVANGPEGPFHGSVMVSISRLGRPVFAARQAVALPADAAATFSFSWAAPPTDFQGYLVEAWLSNGSFAVTALDVSSDWRRYPRYGYVTEFYEGQATERTTEIFTRLTQDYHINSVQFYDWMWRHENVIQVVGRTIADPWIDWRGAHISYAVLSQMVQAAHSFNVAAMPYFQIYIGLDGYETISGVSRQWGLFSDQSHTNQYHHTAGSVNFWVFDPTNANWQNHLMSQYTNALTALNFDGIHLDQLGNIGGGNYYDYYGNSIDLGNGFSPMLNNSKDHLDYLEAHYPALVGHDALTFNMVDGGVNNWGVNDVVRNSRVDFLYSELWGNETYGGVEDFIRESRARSGGKAMVLAAYVNRYDSTGGYFDEDSVRLADAAFFAGGAFHINLGDGDQMLGNEFFPDRSVQMSAALKAAMKDYYNFITAYESLLFAPELTAGDGGLQWISVARQTLSGAAAPDTIWFLTRRTDEFEVLHLINLIGNDDQWRNVADTPPLLANLSVLYRLGPDAEVRGVYFASPDLNHGLAQSLPYVAASDAQGDFVSVTVPSLAYWDMLYFERSVTPPPGDRYEAEDAVKSNVSVNTNHPGYSGTGFVDHFAEEGDGVSFVVAIATDNDYDLQFRYANATGRTATRNIYIDGDYAGTISFPPLTNWDTWDVAELPVRINRGVHQVVLYFGGGNTAAINLDCLDID